MWGHIRRGNRKYLERLASWLLPKRESDENILASSLDELDAN